MIIELDNSNAERANQIFSVFQRSYKIEAQLIGTCNFPPLSRSANAIKDSKTQFYGFIENENLAGVIEVIYTGERLDIESLTVDPAFFRKNIASKLISNVLGRYDFTEAVVETAYVNLPAINLYKKHGFVEFKKWTPSHGIEKIALMKH